MHARLSVSVTVLTDIVEDVSVRVCRMIKKRFIYIANTESCVAYFKVLCRRSHEVTEGNQDFN